MKEALLYEKLEGQKVKCNVCAHRCLILPGHRGICGVRENKEGKLYSLSYRKVISTAIDPIEKKPFYHFLPGTNSYSLATLGCNFRCDNCQNWQISQKSKDGKPIAGEDIPAKEIIASALKSNCQSIAYTYTEPTIFLEYALEIMKLARAKKLKNLWVTNGYLSEETLNLIAPYLDGANVDLKFFDDKLYLKNCGGHLQPILDTLKRMKEKKIWVEITTLAIPALSDQPEMFTKITKFIAKELGAETPWHISRFSPEISFKLNNFEATPLATLEKALEIGKKAGLKYVYLGNVPGHRNENTYCPKCNTLVIERYGYQIKRHDRAGQCPKCGTDLNLILN